MPAWAWIVIALVVIAVIAVAVWSATRKRRTDALRDQFGPEYDRVVDERGDRRDAEGELLDRRERRAALDIRPLDPDARRDYADRWQRAQATFVDSPSMAVTEADVLVKSVMRDRGYPIDQDDERMALVSVDHPELMEHYRSASAVATSANAGSATTEDLRTAMVHYRSLFDTLLREGDDRLERTA